MAIDTNGFLAYLNSGNTENDFSVFLNSLADDENYQKITRNQNTIIVDERVYIQFSERLENKHFNLSNITFNAEVTFQGNFEGLQFVFDNTHFKQLNIFDCKIDSIVFDGENYSTGEFNISNCEIKTTIVDSNIQGNIKFMKCKFDDFNMLNAEKNIDCAAKFIFNFCEVKGIANFMNFKFRDKVSFKMSKFRDNIYFNNSQFYDSADFHECEFEKTACFYGATFEKSPNFSQAIFKGSLNIVNTNLNFDFENLNERIKQECQNFNANKGQENKKTLDKFANDFRDSFRLIKNALIKDNNLLDASNFHKYELYCKEIELEQMWHKQGKTAETEADIKRNTHKFRDYIDCLLLGFYRKLCEHHTDFLKVFNNLILLIVLYALFFKGIAYLHNAKIENINEEFILSKISNNFEFYFNLGLIIFIVLGSILILCKINKNFFIDFIRFCFKKLNFYKRFHCNIRQSFKNFMIFLKILIKDLWDLIESLILAFFFAYAFYVLLVGFGGKIIDLNKDYGYPLFINTLFVGLYISLVYTKSLIIGRYILLIASYMGFFIVLIKYPSIIHPLIGKIADTDKTCTCPSIMALSILYTILIFLVLFSLQKTARKNSIIPH